MSHAPRAPTRRACVVVCAKSHVLSQPTRPIHDEGRRGFRVFIYLLWALLSNSCSNLIPRFVLWDLGDFLAENWSRKAEKRTEMVRQRYKQAQK